MFFFVGGRLLTHDETSNGASLKITEGILWCLDVSRLAAGTSLGFWAEATAHSEFAKLNGLFTDTARELTQADGSEVSH